MEVPLTPLEFARRTRRLHGQREAVVDGDLRLSYEQFFDRCDRWSSALASMGVEPGDRVATIAPNTHAQLESFYAVPQAGAVLVPINYRLTADDFVYIVNHSGATVVCAHSDYLDALDTVKDRMPRVRHFVAFEGAREGWVDYEAAVATASPDFQRPEISERDLRSRRPRSSGWRTRSGARRRMRSSCCATACRRVRTRSSLSSGNAWRTSRLRKA
jgi:fatty-acyl-CoA synthase